jgi:hypothetical protein
MELISSKAPVQGDYNVTVEQNALKLRTKLVEFHAVLHEYREVEATERLITELTTQLKETLQLEITLLGYGKALCTY